MSDHTDQVAQTRSALVARLTACQRVAEDTLDRVAVRSGALLDHADVQARASYDTGGPATVTVSTTDGKPGPNSATHIPRSPDGTFPIPDGW